MEKTAKRRSSGLKRERIWVEFLPAFANLSAVRDFFKHFGHTERSLGGYFQLGCLLFVFSFDHTLLLS